MRSASDLRGGGARGVGHARLDERGDAQLGVVREQPRHEPAADEARESGQERELRHGGRAYEKSPRQLFAPRTLGLLPMRLFGLIALVPRPAGGARLRRAEAKGEADEVRGRASPRRSISPDPDGTFAGKPVYLGGYGIGGGSPVLAGRAGHRRPRRGAVACARSRSPTGAHAVRDRRHRDAGLVRGDEERALRADRHAQGGRGGAPAARCRPRASSIQTDHSHGGADTIGVWGGVPDEYMAFMTDQTVDAIVEAFESMQPGTL